MSIETVAARLGAAPEVALALEQAALRFGVNNAQRASHFLGQIMVESSYFQAPRESLNYAADKLQSVFGAHRISAEDAWRYGRRRGQSANQPAIANIVYGGFWGSEQLGNTEPGDGWRFIGRGYKQLTGRNNYTRYSRAVYGDDRCVHNPELLERLPDAALSAGWFWYSNKLNRFADADDFTGLTRKINGGYNGLEARTKATQRAKAIFEEITQ